MNSTITKRYSFLSLKSPVITVRTHDNRTLRQVRQTYYRNLSMGASEVVKVTNPVCESNYRRPHEKKITGLSPNLDFNPLPARFNFTEFLLTSMHSESTQHMKGEENK